ncbi:MAG: hypothetical protein GY822_23800 [Deltaproteobacteria bacterium]|nr:hypothetical protein [Deltaproteobacteria bacterium]
MTVQSNVRDEPPKKMGVLVRAIAALIGAPIVVASILSMPSLPVLVPMSVGAYMLYFTWLGVDPLSHWYKRFEKKLPIEEEKPKSEFGRQLARYSWLSVVLLAFGTQFLLRGPPLLSLSVWAFCVLSGFGSGIYALASLKKYGRKGVLIPAIIGVLLNSMLLVFGVVLPMISSFSK